MDIVVRGVYSLLPAPRWKININPYHPMPLLRSLFFLALSDSPFTLNHEPPCPHYSVRGKRTSTASWPGWAEKFGTQVLTLVSVATKGHFCHLNQQDTCMHFLFLRFFIFMFSRLSSFELNRVYDNVGRFSFDQFNSDFMCVLGQHLRFSQLVHIVR